MDFRAHASGDALRSYDRRASRPLFVPLGAATDPEASPGTTVEGYFYGLERSKWEARGGRSGRTKWGKLPDELRAEDVARLLPVHAVNATP